jgi:PKD repeat protein
MLNKKYRKNLILLIAVIMIGAVLIPNITASLDIKKDETISINESKFNENSKITNKNGVVFFDDFDDNIKDYTKWTEMYTDGVWDETNQRCEFELYEPGKGVKEGITSSGFSVPLNTITPLIVSWDLIADIDSTNWAGGIELKITDGENWIKTLYSRWEKHTRFIDSNDPDWTMLDSSKPYGTWDNEIQIFSDRYIVRMDDYTSDFVYDSLFTSDDTLYVEIYLSSGGEQPQLYFRSGFDNIMVQFEDYEPPTALFFFKPLNPTTKDIINFNDESYDSDGRIVSWWWDFGNGYYSDLQNPVFQYYKGGIYTISLTVTDDDGATDTIEREITVLTPFYIKS